MLPFTAIAEQFRQASPLSLVRGVVLAFRRARGNPAVGRGVVGIVDQGVVSATSFVTMILLGRFISEDELGLYYLPLTVVMVLVNLQGEVVTAPYTVFRQRREGQDLAEYAGSIIVHQLAITLLGVAVLGSFAALAAAGQLSPRLLAPLLILLGAGPFWLLRSFLRFVLFADLRFGAALLADVVASGLQLLLLALLLGTGRLDAATTYLAMGASSAVAVTGWWWHHRPLVHFRPRRFWPDWCGNWSFARWALVSQLVGCLAPYVLPWLLARAHGEGAAGVFAACTNICGLAMMFVLGLAHALTPHAARAFATGGVPALQGVLGRTALAFLIGVGAFCLAAATAGEWIMQAVYGARFAGTQAVITLLSCGILATSLAIVAGNGLWAVNRPRANLWADVATLLTTVITAGIGVGPWGLVGTALATTLGGAVGAIVRLAILRHVLREITAGAAAV